VPAAAVPVTPTQFFGEVSRLNVDGVRAALAGADATALLAARMGPEALSALHVASAPMRT
jgi:hypothetical protein